MVLVPAFAVGVIFLLAAMIKIGQKQYEHGFTRVLLSMFYFYVAWDHLDIETSRAFARYLLVVLGSVELLSFLVLRFYQNKNLDRD